MAGTSFRHTAVYDDLERQRTRPPRRLSRWSYNDVCLKIAHPPLRAPQARRRDGGDAPAHHRGRRRAARQRRAGAHDDHRDGRARGRAAPDRLPPLPDEHDLFAACSEHFYGAAPLAGPGALAGDRRPRRAARRRPRRALRLVRAHRGDVDQRAARRDARRRGRRGDRRRSGRTSTTRPRALAAGWGARGGRRRVVLAAARHAVDFRTWRSLARDGGVSRGTVVELAAAMVARAASR